MINYNNIHLIKRGASGLAIKVKLAEEISTVVVRQHQLTGTAFI